MSDQPRRSELHEMTETAVVCALVLAGMYLLLGLAYWLWTGGWTWNPAQMVMFLPDSGRLNHSTVLEQVPQVGYQHEIQQLTIARKERA